MQWYLQAHTLYRIHSPTVFQTLQAIFDEERYYNAFEDIAYIRARLAESEEQITYIDYGAGSGGKGVEREPVKIKLSELAGKSASDARQGEQLFKLILHLQPKTILELGSSLGIGSAYLCTPDRSARFIGIEGNPQSAAIAQMHLDMLGCKNAQVWSGTFHEHLPKALKTLQHLDFVYIDGDHRYQPTLEYFETILPYCTEKTVIVFDDIYWTPDMLKAWNVISQRPEVKASVNLWSFGVIWFDPAFQQKQHLKGIPTALKPWQKFI